MGAISAILFSLLSPDKRVLGLTTSYGGTSRIFEEFLPQYGVDVALVPAVDNKIVSAITERFDLVYIETPTNPMLEVLDIERIAHAAHAAGSILIVDSTFATPVNQNPLALGADLVVHSATKYLGGHGDALGGVVVGKRTLVDKVYSYREINGASLSPDSAYLLLRGMKTLQLRVERHNANAMSVAQFLAGHPKVSAVHYPGLSGHPGHEVARRQMRGFGGMLSFSLGDDFEAVRRFCEGLQFAHAAASLGAVETMVGPPALTSHVECTPAQRAALGIPEGLIRYSAGIEDIEDLMQDLERALDGV